MLRKRIIPALLAACMVIAMLPAAAFAADGDTTTDMVASVNGEKYATLQQAIAAIEADAKDTTITLLRDTTLEQYVQIYTNPITLDLGGHTLTSKGGGFDVYEDFTLKNGTLATDTWGVWVQNDGVTFTLAEDATILADRDTTLTNAPAVIVVQGAAANLYGTAESKGENFAVSGNGSTGDGKVTINVYDGAKITAESVAPALYFPNSATLTVTGGTITGGSGIYVKSGNVNISGGTIIANGAKADYQYYGNGAISTGNALVVDNCGYQGGEPNVSITGGTFKSVNADAIGSYAHGDGREAKTGFITGGLFSSDPTEFVSKTETRYVVKSGDPTARYEVTAQEPEKVPAFVNDEEPVATLGSELDATTREDMKNAMDKTSVTGMPAAVDADKVVNKSEVKQDEATKIDVDVQIQVELTAAEKTEEGAVNSMTFTAAPVAHVTSYKGSEQIDTKTVEVTNDMLGGQEITVVLPVPSGFQPKQIKHIFSDGSGEEYFLDHAENGAKTFTWNKEAGTVTFKITKFSTFVLTAEQTYVAPVYASTYRVNLADAQNGTLTSSHSTAYAGTTVTLTATPAEGYAVSSVTVTDAAGKNVAVTAKDGKYTFTMPSSAVTAKAVFEKAAHTNCPSSKFSDVDVTLWYHEALDYVLNANMMNGVSATTFAPNDELSRAMMVTILWRLAGQPVVNYAMPFTDVEADTWYTEAVRWAASTGVVKGMTATTFAPMQSITRQQMVAILYRYAQLKGYDTTQGGMAIREYADFDSIADWALTSMDWAVNAGLVNGRGNNMLVPDGTATRAEAAKVLMVFGQTIVK